MNNYGTYIVYIQGKIPRNEDYCVKGQMHISFFLAPVKFLPKPLFFPK